MANSSEGAHQDEEWLREKYISEGLGQYEIAELASVSQGTVWHFMKKFGIQCRSSSETKLSNADKRLQSEGWLEENYNVRGRTTIDMADELGVSPQTVQRWMRRLGVEVDTKAAGGPETLPHPTGEEHPQWKGGYVKHYGPNWQEQREKALRRDNYQCVDCGITNEEHKAEYGRALTCHHIQPIRTFKRRYDAPEWWERANVLENLVTLCDPHHSKWEGIPLRPTR